MLLDDDMYDPAAVARVVAYLYQDDYDDGDDLPPDVKVQTKNLTEYSLLGIYASVPGLKIASRMIANVSVYATAEYLNIKDLKVLAQEKFQKASQFWNPYPYDDLPAIIDAVWDQTSDSDVGFRYLILKKLAIYHDAITANENCIVAMNEHGDFGLGLVKAVGGYYKSDLCEAREAQDAAEEKHYSLKQGAEVMKHTLCQIHGRLHHMAERRLRGSFKGGTPIGDGGKRALRTDIKIIRDHIRPYAKLEGWPETQSDLGWD